VLDEWWGEVAPLCSDRPHVGRTGRAHPIQVVADTRVIRVRNLRPSVLARVLKGIKRARANPAAKPDLTITRLIRIIIFRLSSFLYSYRNVNCL
jgi:hypothetical protein